MRDLLASSALFAAAARVADEIVAAPSGKPAKRVVSDAPPGWGEPVVIG